MRVESQPASVSKAPKRITLENLDAVLGRSKEQGRTPNFDHLEEYYAPNMRFQDSVQTIDGREPFMAMCKRLAKRSSQLEIEITGRAQNGNEIYFQWTMTINYAKTKSTPLYGCSKLILNEQGQILSQRDYYDLWGDTFDAVPMVGKLYRRMMHKLFG